MHKFFKNLYNEIGKDKALLKELVSDFITIYQDNIEELSHDIEKLNYENISFIAHKLKGSSMNFNMPVFTEAADELETIGKDKLNKNMSKPFDTMKKQFKKFVDAKKEL